MRIALSLFAVLAAAHFAPLLNAGPEGAFKSDDIEVVYQFSLAPSGITAAPDGVWLLSVSQAEKPRTRVVKVSKSGKVEPFPSEKMSDAAPDAAGARLFSLADAEQPDAVGRGGDAGWCERELIDDVDLVALECAFGSGV